MRKILIVAAALLSLTLTSKAEELFKVTLHSNRDAQSLNALGADVVLWVRGGYLVLATDAQTEALYEKGLDVQLLASDVRRDQLAMDGRFDRKNANLYEVLYEEDRIRILLAGEDRLPLSDQKADVWPLSDQPIEIKYYPPAQPGIPTLSQTPLDEIDDLIAEVEQDSLESYTLRLEAFYRRLAGTDSNYAARDWIYSKFVEFGYDSVVIDPFVEGSTYPYPQCYNVIATKVGSTYPDQQIIVGAHFDAVAVSPGADDNASGTAAVLEMARVLESIETDMTIIFITFDYEEGGGYGSHHYVDSAVARGDDIVFMFNADMIGHEDNDTRASLFFGPVVAYAHVWDQLSQDYAGITGDLEGSSLNSDNSAFQMAGFDVLYVQEKNFSPHWHEPTDSSVYMNFDYMTRMVQASLATVYTVDQVPPPIRITSVLEPGDGQSQIIQWQALDPMIIDFCRVSWFPSSSPWIISSVDIPATESSYLIEGLTELQEYGYFVYAYDFEGRTSYAHKYAYSTPTSIPVTPYGMLAMPLREAIDITWETRNVELDFDHFAIIRDGAIIDQTNDLAYVDNDPGLGSNMHYYYVTAVDTDDNHSDTVGIDPVWMKAATLAPDRVLAVNRSCVNTIDFVDETETGAFLREALEGYDFDYYSDTVATTCIVNCGERFDLIDMIDYGVMVIGTEAGRWDDIGIDPLRKGILDTLVYYMSIGGKVVVFGRWGDIVECDTIDYLSNPYSYDNAYRNYFHIDYRVRTTTAWPFLSTVLTSDLIGARSEDANYPNLVWDSLVTLAHANAGSATITEVAGVPCASFAELGSATPEVIYSYDSRDDDPVSEAKPVAWRYLESDYGYIWFEIPLSLFDRSSAIAALTQAVDELMDGSTHAEGNPSGEGLPNEFGLHQNYPNPFNPVTEICYSLPSAAKVNLSIFNILGQKVRTLVDGQQPAGHQSVAWDGKSESNKSVASGIYFYRLGAGDYSESKKMMLLK